MLLAPLLEERPVEEIAVVRDVDARLLLLHVREPALEKVALVPLVEHLERARVLVARVVAEVLNVIANPLAVDDEVSLAVDHVRYHEDLVVRAVGELQR